MIRPMKVKLAVGRVSSMQREKTFESTVHSSVRLPAWGDSGQVSRVNGSFSIHKQHGMTMTGNW